MNMENITIKTDRINMSVDFEYVVLNLSNCLPKVRAANGICSVETDLELKVKNQDWKIASLCQNYSRIVAEYPITH